MLCSLCISPGTMGVDLGRYTHHSGSVPEEFSVPYEVARGPPRAGASVVPLLSPRSPGTFTCPGGLLGATWQPLHVYPGRWRCPGRCVCLWGASGDGAGRCRHTWVPSTVQAARRAPGPVVSHVGPGGQRLLFTNIYICYFICLCIYGKPRGHTCASRSPPVPRDSFWFSPDACFSLPFLTVRKLAHSILSRSP